MKIVHTIAGPFDRARRMALKQTHDAAVANGKEEFLFEGNTVLTRFAYYLLEFLAAETSEADIEPERSASNAQ